MRSDPPSPVVEAELCAAVADALLELGFTDFRIRINHRQLLASVLRAVAIPEPLHGKALVALDKLDKIGPDGVRAEMHQGGIGEDSSTGLLQAFERLRDPRSP